MQKPWSWLVMALFALAGCAQSSNQPPGADEDLGAADEPLTLQEANEAAAQVEVHATPTTGVIRGVAVDEAIRPIAGVFVSVEGTQKNQTTNAQGAFGFDDLEEGVYFVTASHKNYTAGRYSVEVVAGVSDPKAVRIIIVAIPGAAPFIEERVFKLFVSGAVYAPGVGAYNNGATNGLGMGTWSFLETIEANGTVAQFEFDWEQGSALATNGQANVQTHYVNAGGRKLLADGSDVGASPLVARLNATTEAGTAVYISADMRASPSSGLPIGALVNQQVDCFVHIFHNIVPRADWEFGRDGAYPLDG